MSIETLVRESEILVETLDPIVEGIPDLRLQAIADSAWYRLGSVNVFVRDRCGGAVAASLARGLIEQAAYWDWAIATGVGPNHLDQWAALEHQHLSRLADETNDHVWLGWVIPPGVMLEASAGSAIPRNPGDAVRRIGSGLDDVLLDPLRFDGLLSAYRILDVLAHGSYIGAAILAEQPDLELPDRLAAVAIHLATAGATAVTFALAGSNACLDAAEAQFKSVSASAAAIHSLPSQSRVVARRLPRARQTMPMSTPSSIERMFSATDDMTELGKDFLASVDDFSRTIASDTAWVDPSAWLPLQSLRLSLSNLRVVRGGLEGTLGKALMPIAARILFEDGARWEWLLHSVSTANLGESLKALVIEGVAQRDRITKSLQSDGISQSTIEDLLGPAINILLPEPSKVSTPRLDEILTLAYPNASGIDSARAIYSILSQFVHATPISNLHIHRGRFPSLSAPVYAISLQATALGFERIASVTSTLAGIDSESAEQALNAIRARASEIVWLAPLYHFIG